MLLYQSVSLGQRLEAVFWVTEVGSDVRHRGAKVWNEQLCPGVPKGGDSLADLRHPLLTLALQGQRPSTHARSPGRPEWKSLRNRERNGGLCVLMHGRHVAAKLRDHGR